MTKADILKQSILTEFARRYFFHIVSSDKDGYGSQKICANWNDGQKTANKELDLKDLKDENRKKQRKKIMSGSQKQENRRYFNGMAFTANF